jgi:hypothetical protein
MKLFPAASVTILWRWGNRENPPLVHCLAISTWPSQRRFSQLQQCAGAQCSRIKLAGFRGLNDVSCENFAGALSMLRFCKRRTTGFHGSPRHLKGGDKDECFRGAKCPSAICSNIAAALLRRTAMFGTEQRFYNTNTTSTVP